MGAPNREMEDRLGRAERENAAVVALGQWRSRVRGVVLLVFCLAGVVAGIVGTFALRQLSYPATRIVYVNVTLGFVVPFVGLALLGRRVSTAVLRRRMPATIERLSALYEIEPTVLVETARAVDAL